MPTALFRARGHSEVGHVDSVGPTDVPWGKTAEEGVSLQLAATSVDLYSSQDLMEDDTGITRVSMNLVVRLIHAALQQIQRAYGIPDAALTGDLTGGTPSAEVLSVDSDDLGSQERTLYSLGPGPASTRRIELARTKVTDLAELVQSKTAWMTPTATWRVLTPTAGAPLVITDAL